MLEILALILAISLPCVALGLGCGMLLAKVSLRYIGMVNTIHAGAEERLRQESARRHVLEDRYYSLADPTAWANFKLNMKQHQIPQEELQDHLPPDFEERAEGGQDGEKNPLPRGEVLETLRHLQGMQRARSSAAVPMGRFDDELMEG